MTLPTWYDAGTVSVANGSPMVTGLSTLWGGDAIMAGDLFCDPGQPLVPPQRIKTVSGNGSLELWAPWPGAGIVNHFYEIRYVGIIERSTAQTRLVLEQLGDVSAYFDVQVNVLAERVAFDDQPTGYRVLVSNIGGNLSAIYSKKSNASADWSDPAPLGQIGPFGPPGVVWRGAYAAGTTYAINDGVTFNGSSFRKLTNAAAGTSPSGASPPVHTTAWEVLAAKGQNGAGTGDVVGPATAVATSLAVFADATGKTLKQGTRTEVAGSLAAAPYQGIVASPCRICTDFYDINKQMMSRTRHISRDTMQFPRLAFANWRINALGVEVGSGAVASISAAIEYPENIFTRVLFGGNVTGSIADNGSILSDAVRCAIPDGAEFWVRSFYRSAGGIIYSDRMADGLATYAPSGLTDQCMGGTIVDTDPTLNFAYAPIAIVDYTAKPSVLIIGDSRASGEGDAIINGLDPDHGTIARSIGPHFGMINAARGNDKANKYLASNANRNALAAYASHVIVQYGFNDLHGDARSAAQLKADLETILGYFPTKKRAIVTIEPGSNSTDSYATIANQTVQAGNAARVTHNNAVRARTIVGADDYFEVADAIESTRDSGKWKVTGLANGYTTDGVHANPAGTALVRDSRAIDPQRLMNLFDAPRGFATIGDMQRGASNKIVTVNAMRAGVVAFRALKSATQSVPNSTATKVTFPNEAFDMGGYYDAPNSRWRPPAGIVDVNVEVFMTAGLSDQAGYRLHIYKNGVAIRVTAERSSGNGEQSVRTHITDLADGDDYYEAYIITYTGSSVTIDSWTAASVFEGVVR